MKKINERRERGEVGGREAALVRTKTKKARIRAERSAELGMESIGAAGRRDSVDVDKDAMKRRLVPADGYCGATTQGTSNAA